MVAGGSSSFQPGHTLPLHTSTSIGRSPDNTLVLSDSFVSTHHTTLSYRDGTWWVADAGSKNGTWVNGQRIDTEVRLQPGDLLLIGQVKMELKAD